jgi:ubiquinone biosynthesis protein COQ9
MLIDSIENKNLVLEEFLKLCPLEGWSDETLKKACLSCKIDENFSHLVFENGALDVAEFFSRNIDDAMFKQIEALDLTQMKIRDKIKEAVKIRLNLNLSYKAAIKRMINFYYHPKNSANALKNCYKTADLIWRSIGDRSTDFNFYSKRVILGKIYIRALLCFIDDNSENNNKTWNLLDSEIEKVMKIGKIKNSTRKLVEKLGNITHNPPSKTLKELAKKLPFFRLFH